MNDRARYECGCAVASISGRRFLYLFICIRIFFYITVAFFAFWCYNNMEYRMRSDIGCGTEVKGRWSFEFDKAISKLFNRF